MTLRFLTSGESHGAALIAILEGLPAGLDISIEMVNQELARRQNGYGAGPRMKLERDQIEILSGVMEGKTIGSPLTLRIANLNHKQWHSKPIPPYTTPRPGHADLSGAIKYGFEDLRPVLERASARETAARVAVGAVCKQFLSVFDIQIGGYVTSIGGITANLERLSLKDRMRMAEESDVRNPDPFTAQKMQERIREIILNKDTLGGTLEIAVLGLPAGLGSYVQWDRRLDARLGAAVLSIPAIKGVEIGPAFENANLPGTQVHDAIRLDGKDLIRSTNRCGGIEGGMTNGQPLIIRAAMKPIPTTLNPLPTVNLLNEQEELTQYERSDFCPVPRAVPIVEAMVAFVLLDALLEKLGGDSIQEIRERFEKIPKLNLSNLKMNPSDHVYWPDQNS